MSKVCVFFSVVCERRQRRFCRRARVRQRYKIEGQSSVQTTHARPKDRRTQADESQSRTTSTSRVLLRRERRHRRSASLIVARPSFVFRVCVCVLSFVCVCVA